MDKILWESLLMKFMLFIILSIASSSLLAGECSIKSFTDKYTPWNEKINKSPEIYSELSIETDGAGCMKTAIEFKNDLIEKLKQQDINFSRFEYHHLVISFSDKEESIKAKIK